LRRDESSRSVHSAKAAIYDERLLCYSVPKLEKELASLTIDEKRDRVDHLLQGPKDLADTLCGAVWNCEQSFHQGSADPLAIKFGPVSSNKENVMRRLMRGGAITER